MCMNKFQKNRIEKDGDPKILFRHDEKNPVVKYSFLLPDKVFSDSSKDFIMSRLILLKNKKNLKFHGQVDVEFDEETKEMSFSVFP